MGFPKECSADRDFWKDDDYDAAAGERKKRVWWMERERGVLLGGSGSM